MLNTTATHKTPTREDLPAKQYASIRAASAAPDQEPREQKYCPLGERHLAGRHQPEPCAEADHHRPPEPSGLLLLIHCKQPSSRQRSTLNRLGNPTRPPTAIEEHPDSKMVLHPPAGTHRTRKDRSGSQWTANHEISTMTTSRLPAALTRDSRLQVNPEPSRDFFSHSRNLGGLHVAIPTTKQGCPRATTNSQLTQRSIKQLLDQSKLLRITRVRSAHPPPKGSRQQTVKEALEQSSGKGRQSYRSTYPKNAKL